MSRTWAGNTAQAGRRRQIIAEQKHPKDFIAPRYRDARDAISQHLAGGGTDAALIHREIARLRGTGSTSEWHRQDALLSADALESYLGMNLGLDAGLDLSRGADSAPKLKIGVVEVSVRPEVVVRGTTRRGQPFVGAIKLHIVKNGLDSEAGAFAATVMHQWTDEHVVAVEPGIVASLDHCLVVDVFRKQVSAAPRAHARRRSNIRDACEEIALRWSTL